MNFNKMSSFLRIVFSFHKNLISKSICLHRDHEMFILDIQQQQQQQK